MRSALVRFASLAIVAAAACAPDAGGAGADPGGDAGPDVPPPPAACDPADPDPRGPACLVSIDTDARFDLLSIGPTGVQHWARATKYMVPAGDGPAAIPALVQNARRYATHLDFLAAVFLPGLDASGYARIITARATREYFAGNLVRIEDPERGRLYGFTVYTAAKPSELPEPSEVRAIFDRLSAVVTAGPLVFTFEPFDAMGPARAKTWVDPGFPIWFPRQDDVTVEVYSPGVAYGTVRRLADGGTDAALAGGLLGFRDLAVTGTVPFDVPVVVAGLVTGARQWALSHVNVRLARRGTPNLFVRDAQVALASWDGRLVRLEARKGDSIGTDTYEVADATLAEAEAWWAAHRPKLAAVPAVDAAYGSLDALAEMDDAAGGAAVVGRFGGKAANLSKLYAFLDEAYRVPGFGIPFAPFEACLDSTTILDERRDPPAEVTLREHVAALGADPAVSQDGALRASLLAALRDRIETACPVPAPFVAAVAGRIAEVFGGTGVRVRFRSSSNVEDGLEFSGAGLYDSTTVCAADSLDSDETGPSACDPDRETERTVERGLRRVWASLYNDRAWAERDWYQVPQEAASMAVLVTLGFPDEAANGVAFTGDPADPADRRYLVNAQVGDVPVVSAEASAIPETVKLEMEGGEVVGIRRLVSSTLAVPGVPVLSDAQLAELGRVMADIDARYPLDLGEHERDEVLLDLEFKVEKGSNQLRIKQLRPFLLNVTEAR